MCRFLMISSQKPIDPKGYLDEFSDACRRNKAPNGDSQEDGWGAAWLDKNHTWKVKKSLKPIWKEKRKLYSIPLTKVLVIHARSATNPQEKGCITYNQPFIDGNHAYVFNGCVKGVRLKKPVPGNIGSQKIWSLLREKLQEDSVQNALRYIKEYMGQNSQEITALNIGIATRNSLTALCKFSAHPEYYTLHHSTHTVNMICSEKMNGFVTAQMRNDQILSL